VRYWPIGHSQSLLAMTGQAVTGVIYVTFATRSQSLLAMTGQAVTGVIYVTFATRSQSPPSPIPSSYQHALPPVLLRLHPYQHTIPARAARAAVRKLSAVTVGMC